jgi:integrase
MAENTHTTLIDFVENVYLNERVVGEGQATHLRNTAAMLTRYLERESLVSDLVPEKVNGFLRSIEQTRSPSTMASRRGHLMALMLSAADHGLVAPVSPRLIRRYRKNAPSPESWTPEDVDRIIVAARTMPGEHKGVRRSLWWEAYIRVAYETGLRPVDIHRLSLSHFDVYGVVSLIQHKTSVLIVRRASEETLELLSQLGRDPLFGDWIGIDQRTMWFARIVAVAGSSGTFYKLRSTCGTLVEQQNPGKGHVALGNGRAVFERHYWARSIQRDAIPMPPPLAAANQLQRASG